MGASTFKNLIALHGVPQAKNIQVAMNYNNPLEGDFTDDTETAAMLVGRSRAACALGGDIFLHVADTVATLSRHLMFHHNGFRTCDIGILLGHIIGPLATGNRSPQLTKSSLPKIKNRSGQPFTGLELPAIRPITPFAELANMSFRG